MPQRILRRMVTAIVAAGLVAGTGHRVARLPGPIPRSIPIPLPSMHHRWSSRCCRLRRSRCRRRRRRSASALARRRRRSTRWLRRPSTPGAAAVDPLAPPPVDPLAPIARRARSPTVIPEGTPAGQNPTPYVGATGLRAADLQPAQRVDGGRGQADLHQLRAAHRQPAAGRRQAVHISSVPPVPGKFYWANDSQLRWRPIDFWPANTIVNIDAGGTKSSFRTGDSLVATVDNATHQMTIIRNGKVEKTFPVSMGKTGPRHPQRHLLRAGEVPEHRDGLRDLRGAQHRRRRATS